MDISDLGIERALWDRLDYASISALSIHMFIDLLNSNGEIAVPFRIATSGLSSADKIAIIGIIVSVIIAVSGFFVSNRTQPAIINTITYVQPYDNNYSDVFKDIIEDLINPTPSPSSNHIKLKCTKSLSPP